MVLDATLFNTQHYKARYDYRPGYDIRSIFKQSLPGFNSEFSFSYTSCLTKAEEPSLSYYLPIAGERIIGFIPFPRVLVLCEMQSVSSRIWTRVAVSISYDDNPYTTGTSILVLKRNASEYLNAAFPFYKWWGTEKFSPDHKRKLRRAMERVIFFFKYSAYSSIHFGWLVGWLGFMAYQPL